MAKNYFISPKGTAKYPHLVEPDTEGQYATGKYTTKIVMTPEDAAPFIAAIDKVAAEHSKTKTPKLPYKPEMVKDGDGKKPSGKIEFSFSSKFAPMIFDFKNRKVKLKKMNEDFDISSGSVIAISGEMYEYDKGVSLQMQQVQVIDLVAGRTSAFGETEGTFDQSEYEADGEDVARGDFAESNDNSLGI